MLYIKESSKYEKCIKTNAVYGQNLKHQSQHI